MTDATQEVATTTGATGETSRQRVFWLAIVLLLILLFLGCSLLQLLLPTPRSSLGKAQTAGWTSIFSIYGLHQPLGVASGPRGEIAVSDTGVQKVLLFDDQGSLVRRIGGAGPTDQVYSVNGLMFAEDRLLVCDWGLCRVWIFGTDGTVKAFFPEDPTAPEYGSRGLVPYDVVAFGSEYLVASRDGIHRFDQVDGGHIGSFEETAQAGPLLFASGLAADEKTGRVFVADALHRRVVAYDREGKALWSLGRQDVEGRAVSFFGLPRGLVITDKGLLVSDALQHRTFLLDQDGRLLGSYGQRGVTDGALNFPEGLDVAPDGLVYLADRENNRIQVLRLGEPTPPEAELQGKWERDHVSY